MLRFPPMLFLCGSVAHCVKAGGSALLFHILLLRRTTNREGLYQQKFPPLLVEDSQTKRQVCASALRTASWSRVKAGQLLACAASNKNTDSREISSLFLALIPLISAERLCSRWVDLREPSRVTPVTWWRSRWAWPASYRRPRPTNMLRFPGTLR